MWMWNVQALADLDLGVGSYITAVPVILERNAS